MLTIAFTGSMKMLPCQGVMTSVLQRTLAAGAALRHRRCWE